MVTKAKLDEAIETIKQWMVSMEDCYLEMEGENEFVGRCLELRFDFDGLTTSQHEKVQRAVLDEYEVFRKNVSVVVDEKTIGYGERIFKKVASKKPIVAYMGKTLCVIIDVYYVYGRSNLLREKEISGAEYYTLVTESRDSRNC